MEDQWLNDLVDHWGPGLRAFMMGLTRNGLSGTPAEIPLSGYVAFMRFYTLLRRDAWEFSYLPGDAGTTVIDPLAKRIEELGGAIQLGASIDRLERSGDQWTAHSPTGSFSARSIILATDARHARALLCASENTRGIAETLHFPRSLPTAILRFWYDTQPKSKVEAGIITGEAIVDNYFWLHRLQDQYARWSKATGGSAIEAYLWSAGTAGADVRGARPATQSAFHPRGHLIHQHL
jgi:isorenieratene synthase